MFAFQETFALTMLLNFEKVFSPEKRDQKLARVGRLQSIRARSYLVAMHLQLARNSMGNEESAIAPFLVLS